MKIDWKKLKALSKQDKIAVKLLAWLKNYLTACAAFTAAVNETPAIARKRYGSKPDPFGLITLALEHGAAFKPIWDKIEAETRALIIAMVMEALRQAFKIG
jgi:hypothetical protein